MPQKQSVTTMTDDQFKRELVDQIIELTTAVSNLSKELKAIKKELEKISYSSGISS